MTMVMYIVALKLPELTQKIGNARILHIGMIIVCFFQNSFGYWWGIGVPMLLIGAGQSMSISPLTVSGVIRTRGEESGAASGLVNAVHQIGGAVGLAFVALVAGNINNQVMRYQVSMITATIFVIIALISSFFLIHSNRMRR